MLQLVSWHCQKQHLLLTARDVVWVCWASNNSSTWAGQGRVWKIYSLTMPKLNASLELININVRMVGNTMNRRNLFPCNSSTTSTFSQSRRNSVQQHTVASRSMHYVQCWSAQNCAHRFLAREVSIHLAQDRQGAITTAIDTLVHQVAVLDVGISTLCRSLNHQHSFYSVFEWHLMCVLVKIWRRFWMFRVSTKHQSLCLAGCSGTSSNKLFK